tara:strand:- start:659 stop:943 length:285 start_codon:yes stop_codon:yes gene_type:complete
MDHEAIYRAYAGTVVSINDSTGAYDINSNLVTIDNAKVIEARTAIDAELAATKYQRDREAEYPSWQDQLDKIYHSGIDAWKADIKIIKDKYPKP